MIKTEFFLKHQGKPFHGFQKGRKRYVLIYVLNDHFGSYVADIFEEKVSKDTGKPVSRLLEKYK